MNCPEGRQSKVYPSVKKRLHYQNYKSALLSLTITIKLKGEKCLRGQIIKSRDEHFTEKDKIKS